MERTQRTRRLHGPQLQPVEREVEPGDAAVQVVFGCQATRKPGRSRSGAGGSYQIVTTNQGPPPSLGLPAPAEIAVSVLMMLTDVCEASQALICSSITFARLSMNIFTCSGLAILLAPIRTRRRCRAGRIRRRVRFLR